ncbi:hypothetical protein TNCV_815151 [Trichonephila clavipes]|nr:hypothetical protein TNCV_815151 [Trichonephila clavipes]
MSTVHQSHESKRKLMLTLMQQKKVVRMNLSGWINEYQACLGTEHWEFSCQTNHFTETSAHAPERLRSRKLRWAQLTLALMGCCATEFNSNAFLLGGPCYFETRSSDKNDT